MRTLFNFIVAGSIGILAGFFGAVFLQALGKMSAEDEARRKYLSQDPWDVLPDDYDKHKDDTLTN